MYTAGRPISSNFTRAAPRQLIQPFRYRSSYPRATRSIVAIVADGNAPGTGTVENIGGTPGTLGNERPVERGGTLLPTLDSLYNDRLPTRATSSYAPRLYCIRCIRNGELVTTDKGCVAGSHHDTRFE